MQSVVVLLACESFDRRTFCMKLYINNEVLSTRNLPMVSGSSPGTPASSTTKTGRHNIAEILLKVALNTINQSINQSYKQCTSVSLGYYNQIKLQ